MAYLAQSYNLRQQLEAQMAEVFRQQAQNIATEPRAEEPATPSGESVVEHQAPPRQKMKLIEAPTSDEATRGEARQSTEPMRRFHEERQYRAHLEEEREFLKKTQNRINILEAKIQQQGGTPAQRAELRKLYADVKLMRGELGVDGEGVEGEGLKFTFTSQTQDHPLHIAAQAHYTLSGVMGRHEGTFCGGQEAKKNPFHKEEYTKGHHLLYDDKRKNNDPAKQLVEVDYDFEKDDFIFYGINEQGKKVKSIGHPTIGKGIRVCPLLKESFNGRKPKTMKSVEKAYIIIGSEKIFIGPLLKGIEDKKSDALYEQRVFEDTYTLETKLGDGNKQRGAERMKKLGKKKCDAIINLGFNGGWGMPNTLNLMRELADNPDKINDPKWLASLHYEIAEVCTSKGVFMDGLLTRKLENIESIIDRRLEDEELEKLSKKLTDKLKNNGKNPGFISIQITFNKEERKYDFEIKPTRDKK